MSAADRRGAARRIKLKYKAASKPSIEAANARFRNEVAKVKAKAKKKKA